MKLNNQQILLDGDWIVYMSCMAVEYGLEEHVEPRFEDVLKVFDYKLKEIQKYVETDKPPILYYTGKNNYRIKLATSKPYKGNRKQEKPFHYNNLKNYLELNYETLTVDTVEADDLMAMNQSDKTIIVTVDKDLRQVNGWHFSPEGHNYPSFGPTYVTDDNSYIEWKNPDKKAKGVVGTGWRFFYYQLLIGDSTDNIPGLPGCGPAGAYPNLVDVADEYEAYEVVRDMYRDKCLMADDYLLEQANLLWMVRGLHRDNSPILWHPPLEPDPYSVDYWDSMPEEEV